MLTLNHFSPYVHPEIKRRQGERIVKLFEKAKTPYQRMVEYCTAGRCEERLSFFS